MAELPLQVANWLYNVLQPQYTNKQVTYSHIYQFLEVHFNMNFKFKIRTSVYTSGNTGHSNLLINLYGLIEVNQQTNIPVTIWVPLNYPYNVSNQATDDIGVPMVYITPDNSRNWYLKPGNHVDTQGKFYHPYLTSWFHDYNKLPSNYNLLELVNILYNSLIKDVPIFYLEPLKYLSPVNTGLDNRNVPAKPAKIPINLSAHGPLPNSSDTELADSSQHNIAPVVSHIPLKYQEPLPLPNEMIFENSQRRREIPISKDNDMVSTCESNLLTQTQPISTPVRSNNLIKPNTPGIFKKDTLDLMDNDDRNTTKKLMNPTYQKVLGLLSYGINEHLRVSTEGSINDILPTVNTNTKKIDALYRQLSHHNQQAIANRENLESHIVYLTTQLSNLTSLNNELVQLDGLNSLQNKTISTNQKTQFELDNLIIPDLALVNQLYDIVSEIKATKDTINLIGGNFTSESEIINDNRMDACVKAVRNLGRELFWLEVMKREIAADSMGLSS